MTPWTLNPQVADLPINELQGQLELLEDVLLEHDVVKLDVAAPNAD